MAVDCNLSDLNMTMKEADKQAQLLVQKAMKAVMKIDQIKTIEHLSGFVDRKKIVEYWKAILSSAASQDQTVKNESNNERRLFTRNPETQALIV